MACSLAELCKDVFTFYETKARDAVLDIPVVIFPLVSPDPGESCDTKSHQLTKGGVIPFSMLDQDSVTSTLKFLFKLHVIYKSRF